MKERKLYGTIKFVEESAYGEKFRVTVHNIKKVRLADDQPPIYSEDGIELSQYVDYQGRIYQEFHTVDYFGKALFIRDDGDHFQTRPDRLSRDVFGHPLTEYIPSC